MSMSSAAIPTFEIQLKALARLLDKAEAHASAKKFDVSVLLNSRLAPDMLPLTRQIQLACDFARRGAARLAGIEPGSVEDKETTIAELKQRIDNTIKFVKSVDPAAIDGSAKRVITLPLVKRPLAAMLDRRAFKPDDQLTQVRQCEPVRHLPAQHAALAGDDQHG